MKRPSGLGHILIRADASAVTGSGHIMRMIALAQAWLDRGGVVTIACCECPEKLQIRLIKENIKYCQLSAANPGNQEDQIQTVALAVELKCTWVVLDGYQFSGDFHRRLREQGLKVMAVDDYGQNNSWEVDAILNQNVSATDIEYTSLVDDCRIMLGTSFALLRKEFTGEKPPIHRQVSATPKILVTLGGGDPDNATAKILTLLNNVDQSEFDIRVLVGALNPHVTELTRLAAESCHRIEILKDVTDMPSMYKWADGVISAGGSTCWEWLYFGLPAAVVVIADNQEAIANKLASRGLAVNLGWHDKLSDIHALNALSHFVSAANLSVPSEASVVDGAGARRICAMLDGKLRITIATANDGWLTNYLPGFVALVENAGHQVRVVFSASDIGDGDILFLLSMWGLVPTEKLGNHTHNLVVHESDLPRGRGWSPITWSLLEGANDIEVCLLEAVERADSGHVYLRDRIYFDGHELIEEIRDKQANVTFRLCERFIASYPEIVPTSEPQRGEPTYLRRRTPVDSELNPEATIADQFNMLRIADNDAYPAFLFFRGHRYVLTIKKAPTE